MNNLDNYAIRPSEIREVDQSVFASPAPTKRFRDDLSRNTTVEFARLKVLNTPMVDPNLSDQDFIVEMG